MLAEVEFLTAELEIIVMSRSTIFRVLSRMGSLKSSDLITHCGAAGILLEEGDSLGTAGADGLGACDQFGLAIRRNRFGFGAGFEGIARSQFDLDEGWQSGFDSFPGAYEKLIRRDVVSITNLLTDEVFDFFRISLMIEKVSLGSAESRTTGSTGTTGSAWTAWAAWTTRAAMAIMFSRSWLGGVW